VSEALSIAIVSYAVGMIVGYLTARMRVTKLANIVGEALVDAAKDGRISKEEFIRIISILYDIAKYGRVLEEEKWEHERGETSH